MTGTLVNLQALRAWAAILVLFHHAHAHYLAMGGQSDWFSAIARPGFAGVDIFFVLSGYVIARSMSSEDGRQRSTGQFLYRRFGRIYLGYWPFFLISMLAATQLYPDFLGDKKILESALLVTPLTQYSVVTPAWSLAYELYFYGLFALISVFSPINRAAILVLLAIAITAAGTTIVPGWSAWPDFLLSAFVLEFLAGVLLFRLGTRLMSPRLILLLLPGLVLGVYLGMTQNLIWGLGRSLSYGFAAVCLVQLALILETNRFLRADRISVAIGDASYTLYLCHTIFLALFYHLGIRDWWVAQGWVETGFWSLMLVIILFSLIFYRWVERPLYRWYCSLNRPAKTANGDAGQA